MGKSFFILAIGLLIISVFAILFQFKGLAENTANWAYISLLAGVGRKIWNFFTGRER